MNFPQITRFVDLAPSKWAGGTTTELFIYPLNSSFASRNFDLRLSRATVELETSDFTPLPGFSRLLMVLEGEISLDHLSHHSTKLKKFYFDRFEGEWDTKSTGVCVDFNVIFKDGQFVDPQGITLQKGDWLRDKIVKADFIFVFCHSGELAITFNESTTHLAAGDLWSFEDVADACIAFEASVNSDFVYLKIIKDLDGV
jgi:environmental stress-induced protein Ves